MSPVHERRWEQYPDTPIIEWTLDGNIHMTYRHRYGGILWTTFDVEGDTVDLTKMQDEFVEDNLLEPLESAGFEVEYQTETEPKPGILRRVATFITP